MKEEFLMLLKKVWNTIVKAFHKARNSKYFYYIILTVIIVILLMALNKSCKENRELRSNEVALSTSLSEHKNKNKELYYKQQVYAGEIKDLKNANSLLYQEIKKYKENITEAVITEITVMDTIKDTVSFIIKPNLNQSFQIRDSILSLTAIANVKDSTMKIYNFSYELSLPLFVGFEYNKKKKTTNVILKSAPQVQFKNTEAYSFPNPKKRFGFTVTAGLSAGYDILHNNSYVGVGIGAGLSYIF